MGASLWKSAVVAGALALSALAQAQEAPGIAGRVSVAQGDVSLESAQGRGDAAINWPVTGGDIITAGRGARAEVRIGSTAVRLDGESSLEVVRLDEDSLRLRLYYGSLNVRVMNRDLLDGFEVETPHGSVRMHEPGRIRVDAERAPQSTAVHVFEGVAVLSVPGSTLTVREGRSAEAQAGDVRTGAAIRDGFDDWAWLRDLRDDRAMATRYIPREMTGYEELDQHGSWRDSAEYGPLWIPRAVPVGWVPYRDGRWTWIAPWGWTWVDNAPWGYAPSHYGRWVMVNSRWCWAPGRRIARPVWAPALVGWIGGSNWNLSFTSGGHRHRPAQGWYPLSPHDEFIPYYVARRDHLKRINHGVRPPRDRRRGHHPHGLTVVPQEHFGRHGVVNVGEVPRAVLPSSALPVAAAGAPPSPLQKVLFRDRGRNGADRPAPYVQGAGPLMPNPQPQAGLHPQAGERDAPRGRNGGRRNGEDRNHNDERDHRRSRTAQPVMEHVSVSPAIQPPAPAPQPAPVPSARSEEPRTSTETDHRRDGFFRRVRDARAEQADSDPRDTRRRGFAAQPEQPRVQQPAPSAPPPVMQPQPEQRHAMPPPSRIAPPEAPRLAPAPMAAPPAQAQPAAQPEPVRGRRGPTKFDEDIVR